ncbi:MAG: DNA-processing protein DprA [Pseudomonadota bacterium]
MERQEFSSAHPPIPPISEEDSMICLRLLRSRRVGPATYHRLMAEHGSPAAAFAALPEMARQAGIDDYAPCPEGVAMAELKRAKAAGARAIWHGQASYPRLLADVPDAPPLLWARGPRDPNATEPVGIVGARNASSLGTRMARRLGGDLGAAGLCIVSGLARGVDAQAHHAALDTGTIAVVAGGVDVSYPAENTELMNGIAERGLVLSEMPLGTQPQARHFPRRNRIIAGISRALVVVEAAARSGSLITAEIALDYGREVMAVPGHPFDARAGGCLRLLRDGATLVRSAADVLEALDVAPAAPRLPLEAPPAPKRPLRETAALHTRLLSQLGPSPLAEDQLIRSVDAAPASVSSAILDLEMDGRIERQTGGLLALKSG